MKKTIFSLALVLVSATLAFAQKDPREPGLYAVNGDESVQLTHVMSAQNNSSTSILGVEVAKTKYSYKGVTSDTKACGKFVLVCDMDKKNIKQTLKVYDVFVKSMTPDNMIIIPLVVDKKKRLYDEGTQLNGFNTSKKQRMSFEWEQISDNSYSIEAELEPGEYAIAFRPAKLGGFNFTAVFDFTVEETAPDGEDAGTGDAPDGTLEEAGN